MRRGREEGREPYLVLLASEIPKVAADAYARRLVVRCRRLKEPQPAVDEHARVLPRRAEVHQPDLSRGRLSALCTH